MISHVSCTRLEPRPCTTWAEYPGCPRWSEIRCVNCDAPVRYAGCDPNKTIVFPIWHSFISKLKNPRWVIGPREADLPDPTLF